ncbi:MAG: OB-fold domain-containing protein [Solirubrobacterales bacterium]
MSDHAKPLPFFDADNLPFWESCREHAMRLQECAECGFLRYYPGPVCPECSSRECRWAAVAGTGTVYTFSVVERPASPAFAADVPYVYAVVELDEGPMMPTNVVDVDPAEVTIGMRVEIAYRDVTPEVTLPAFRPAGGRGR